MSSRRPALSHVFVLLALVVLGASIPARAAAARVEVSNFPLLKQQHTLTCESSVASMGTRGGVSEAQIMAAMPRDPNPNYGFRGNPDGPTGGLVDYGVYVAPVHAALLRFGYQSKVLSYSTDDQVKAYLSRGWPVMVWITYALQHATPQLSQHDGVRFILVPHEHSLLAVGYDARNVIAQDPYSGKRVLYPWHEFNRSWGYFGNMALAIQPCALAQPIRWIKADFLSPMEIKWSWPKAVNAVRYRVTILRHGTPEAAVFKADQTAQYATVIRPEPGTQYEISVRALSSCNVSSAALRLSTELVADLPTPTPAITKKATPTAQRSSPTSTPVPTTASTRP